MAHFSLGSFERQPRNPRSRDDVLRQHDQWIDELLAATRETDRFRVQSGAHIVRDDDAVGGGLMTEVVQLSLHAAVDNLAAAAILRTTKGAGAFQRFNSRATAARSSLEPALVAWWLMRPDELHERLTRLIRLKLQDAYDMHDYSGDRGSDAHEREKAQLYGIAEATGIPRRSLRDRFSIAEIAKDFDLQRGTMIAATWKLSSGLAHGRRWALRLTSSEEARVTRGGRTVLTLHPNLDVLAGVELEPSPV